MKYSIELNKGIFNKKNYNNLRKCKELLDRVKEDFEKQTNEKFVCLDSLIEYRYKDFSPTYENYNFVYLIKVNNWCRYEIESFDDDFNFKNINQYEILFKDSDKYNTVDICFKKKSKGQEVIDNI